MAMVQVLNTTTFYKHTYTKSRSPTITSYYKIHAYFLYKLGWGQGR